MKDACEYGSDYLMIKILVAIAIPLPLRGIGMKKKLLQDALLGHGDIVTAGIFDHIHHLVGLADDLM